MNAETTRHSFLLAVHTGAGAEVQAPAEVRAHEQLIRSVLRGTLAQADSDWTVCDVAVAAVTALEQSELSNAGYGSSLNINGVAECDAAVATHGSVGAIGAVRDVVHPCQLANTVRRRTLFPSPLGLRAPVLVAGEGAVRVALECGLEVRDGCHISSRARRQWTRYTARLKDTTGAEVACPARGVSDTVGAVCIDSAGRMAAASSSGGNWLKPPGRVGAAGVPGAGLSVVDGVAAVCSGDGERIIAHSLAVQCTTRVAGGGDLADLSDVVRECQAGCLLLHRVSPERVEIALALSAAEMVSGYFCSASMKAPIVRTTECDHGGFTIVGNAVRLPRP